MSKKEESFGLGGILGGLGSLLEKLGDLAEKGKELRESGEFPIGEKGKAKGVYGFSVKVGVGEEGIQVEPFGNLRKDSKTGKTVADEVCEPLVDLFEEAGKVSLIAELPGIGADDVKLELNGDNLNLKAANKARKYSKEIQLPAPFTREQMSYTCRNGILEVIFKK